MQIVVVFRHMDPSDGLRQYSARRLSRHRARTTLSARRIAVAGAEETEDMYAAIDLVVDKLDRQIRETRERRREPRRSAEA